MIFEFTIFVSIFIAINKIKIMIAKTHIVVFINLKDNYGKDNT